MKHLTDEQLSELEMRTWGRRDPQLSPHEARALILHAVALRGQVAMLTDAVVSAAALWFAQLDGPQADCVSESLHELAASLVKENPRLRGAFRPEEG